MPRLPLRTLSAARHAPAPLRLAAVGAALASLGVLAVAGGAAPVSAAGVPSPTGPGGRSAASLVSPPLTARARLAEAAPGFRAATTSRPRPVTPPAKPAAGTPREIGRALAAKRGWTGAQWTCLDNLWTRESDWRVHETNGSSGAYGIPQALPAGKMASAGGNWRDSAATQIRWGLGYIADRYGTPCAAWRHSESHNYY